MTALNVLFDISTASRFPVYCQYSGQCQPQPAFLRLDIRTGELDADYSGEIGNAVPVDVWNSLVLRFKLSPESTADVIEAIIEEHKPLFQQILDGSDSVWHNGNLKGKFTDEVNEILLDIDQQALFYQESGKGGVIDLATWIETQPFPVEGQSIEAFAQEIIDSDGNEGWFFIEEPDLDSMLSDLRHYWCDCLNAGHDIPVEVAKHLIEYETCEDSLYFEELNAFANA